jgi:hypothetical protein
MPSIITDVTNRKFSESDEMFLKACRIADLKPSRAQASKFRRKMGFAYTCFKITCGKLPKDSGHKKAIQSDAHVMMRSQP